MESRGVGSVARSSVDNTMIRLRDKNYQTQRSLMTSVVKKRRAFQETLTVAVATIHIANGGGEDLRVVLSYYIMEYELVHIGKCGGNTVYKVLKSLNLRYVLIHIRTVIFNPKSKYIILIRNPISRFISAFNWRFHLVCETKTQQHRFRGEEDLLMKFKTVNSLAESLYTPDGVLNFDFSTKEYYIHHIYEDIHFYIGDFLDVCNAENVHGIILTETIHKDLKSLFNTEEMPHILKNKNYDTNLTDLGYANLKKYLHKDYECIEKMYRMGLITKEQYDILSV